MKRRILPVLLALEAAFCLSLTLAGGSVSNFFTDWIAFPLEQISFILRQLSLSGPVGNGISILLYAVISLSPLLFLLRKNRHWEDLFLLLLSGQLFLSLYCMINPGLISRELILSLGEAFEKALMGSMFYSLLAGYIVLRMVRSFFAADRPQLLRYLRVFLTGACVILVYVVFADGLSGLLKSFQALQEGNQGNEHLLDTSYVFLTLRYLVDALPCLLDIFIIFGAQALLCAEPNTDEAIYAANRLSKYCGKSLVTLVLSSAAYHIFQLLFLKKIYQSSITVELPLFSLLFILAVLLVAQYIRENKELKDDNDLFI